MKKMNKQEIIVLASVAIAVIGIVIAIVIPIVQGLPDPVILTSWNEENDNTPILEVPLKGEVVQDSHYGNTSFDTDWSLKEIIENNQEYYVGKGKYCDGILECKEGELFFANNNYYILMDYGEYYHVYSCNGLSSLLEFSEGVVYFPCPADLEISYDAFASAVEYAPEDPDVEYEAGNELNKLYDNFTFEEACEFYERISEDIVKIDKENQGISVKSYDRWLEKYVYDIVFDFTNRTVTCTNGETTLTLDGTEVEEPEFYKYPLNYE